MTDSLDSRMAECEYAPLNAKGPLPPGLTVRTIKEAYRTVDPHVNFNAHRVLVLARLPRGEKRPQVALRDQLICGVRVFETREGLACRCAVAISCLVP